jgi:hypothetical protein
MLSTSPAVASPSRNDDQPVTSTRIATERKAKCRHPRAHGVLWMQMHLSTRESPSAVFETEPSPHSASCAGKPVSSVPSMVERNAQTALLY